MLATGLSARCSAAAAITMAPGWLANAITCRPGDSNSQADGVPVMEKNRCAQHAPLIPDAGGCTARVIEKLAPYLPCNRMPQPPRPLQTLVHEGSTPPCSSNSYQTRTAYLAGEGVHDDVRACGPGDIATIHRRDGLTELRGHHQLGLALTVNVQTAPLYTLLTLVSVAAYYHDSFVLIPAATPFKHPLTKCLPCQ
jgi:hypothetical protein